MNVSECVEIVTAILERDARIEELKRNEVILERWNKSHLENLSKLESEIERLTNYITDRMSPVVDTVAKASNEGCLVLDCGNYSLELGYEASRAIVELQAKLDDQAAYIKTILKGTE